MDTAEKTMIENLHKVTGKTVEEWIKIVREKEFSKHGQIIKFLQEEHGFTYGFANLVAHKSKGSDANSIEDKSELIVKQYKGKEHFMLLYEKLLTQIKMFGDDIEVSPKNTYVSLRRKKQFAILQPATKSRFEIGVNLKGQEATGLLELTLGSNSMCSHKINLQTGVDITEEVLGWIKQSYTNAG